MSMINIDELHREQDKKRNQKKKVFEDILSMCHNKIKATAKTEDSRYCFFKIPIYIYGIPMYDLKSCVIYLVTSLSKNGFDVKYYHPNLVFISWLGKTNKSIDEKKKTPQIITKSKPLLEYKSINNYKPSGNFVYDNSSLNLFEKSSNKLFK